MRRRRCRVIELTAFEIVMIALAGALVLLAGVVVGAFIAFYAMDKMCEDDNVLEGITKEMERN